MILSLFPIFLLLTIGVLISGFEFDRDASPELCEYETTKDPGICTVNSTMWFSCPISCANVLCGNRGTMAEERNEPEQFYELRAKRASVAGSSGDISLEENEGYITIYATIPMLPGMAQYYYNAIEHISHVYRYTLVAMILPCYSPTQEQDEKGASIASTSGSAILRTILDSQNDEVKKKRGGGMAKSIVLEGYDAQQKSENAVLKYLLTRKVVAGSLAPGGDVASDNDDDEMLLMTRPNIFLVSHTGMFLERLVSPTMKMIERRIKVHEIQMQKDFDL